MAYTTRKYIRKKVLGPGPKPPRRPDYPAGQKVKKKKRPVRNPFPGARF